MKLYVLQYIASYTGGSLVVSANDITELAKIVNEHGDLITDPLEIAKLALHELPFMLHGYKYDDFINIIADDKYSLIRSIIMEGLTDKELLDYPGYTNGNVRPDWFHNLKPIDGIYIVHEDITKLTTSKVINNSYHCG